VKLIAVDGPSGSGKSTFAAALAAELSAVIVPTDHFATWSDPVSWWPRLVAVLDSVARGEPGRYRRMDWSAGWPRPGEWVTVDPTDTLIIEGVSAARRSIAPRLAEAVWVELPDERTRLERAVARDGEASRAHLLRWQAFERGWFAVDNPKPRATRLVLTT
jgi:Cytidylate kinase